jgi:hypothetical protein
MYSSYLSHTTKSNSVLDNFQVFWPPQFWCERAASPLDDLSKRKIRFATPVVLLATSTQDHSAVVPPRENMGGFASTMRSAEIHVFYRLLRAFY